MLKASRLIPSTRDGKRLAWLTLKHKLHADEYLKVGPLNCLWDCYDHAVAMTFVDGEPACVVPAAEYGQLMAYTKRKYRRMDLAKRTAQVLCRQLGLEASAPPSVFARVG